MYRRFFEIIIMASLLGLGACGDDDNNQNNSDGCNPLASEWDCLLPYPSDVFLVDDPAMPSGKRVVIPEAAQPEARDSGKVDLMSFAPPDGFGIQPQIVALFPFEVDDENLVFHLGDLDESLGPDSPTVLLEADTGIRVVHFAELDPRADRDDRRGLVIRPLERLQHATRYIVAIRRLRQADAQPVPPAPGFARLRDGTAGADPVLGQLVDHYENQIFEPLSQAGIERSELQLAWDFTTATEEHQTADMLRVRQLTTEALDAAPPPVTVEDATENYGDDHIFRRIEGVIEIPLFMEHDRPGTYLHRDAEGQVTANGTTEFDFTILIPYSVADASPLEPVRFLQYGHGFFGSRREIDGSFVRSFADALQMVVIGIDWVGMSTPDTVDVIANITSNMSETLRFTERVHQAMANQIAVTYAAKTTLAELPELKIDGQLVYDPERVYFYGISQGHILGATYLALSPHIEQAVLGVGGCSFPFMMFRSSNFVQFLVLIEYQIPDFLDHQKFVALSQTVFERVDPITYAPHLLNDLYPGSPATRTVLMQIGIGDAQVPNLASHLHARAVGLSHLQPAPREIYGLPTVDGTVTTSALVEFDFNLAGEIPGTYAAPPTEGNEVHEGVRRLTASQTQIDAFLRPGGVIVNTCDGYCDPE